VTDGRGAARVRYRSRVKFPAAVALLCFAASACGLFTVKEPYERWNITVSYIEDDAGEVSAEPGRLSVHGPRGEIRIDNSTDDERGFRIRELGVAAEIDDNSFRRIDVTGAEDGETYTFDDHLHPGGPRGVIVVDYIRQD
jgi:hypothetical protein